MAMYKFALAVITGQPLTPTKWRYAARLAYADDVAEGSCVWPIFRRHRRRRLIRPRPCDQQCPYRVYNIGCHRPVIVRDVVRLIEQHRAKGDCRPATGPSSGRRRHANVDRLHAATVCHRRPSGWVEAFLGGFAMLSGCGSIEPRKPHAGYVGLSQIPPAHGGSCIIQDHI